MNRFRFNTCVVAIFLTIVLLTLPLFASGCANHKEIARKSTQSIARILGKIAIGTLKLQGVDGSLSPLECYKDPDQLNIWCWDESKKRFIKSVDKKSEPQK